MQRRIKAKDQATAAAYQALIDHKQATLNVILSQIPDISTFAQIAELIGYSHEWVRQRLARAPERLFKNGKRYAARKREPWAIQAVLQRLAPEIKQIEVNHGLQDATLIDYARLSQAELDQLQGFLERATVPAGTGESGERAPSPEGICHASMADPRTEHQIR